MRFQTVRGTRDILPGEVEAWQQVESALRETFVLYGFREIRTPIFEQTDLFTRGVGAGTDIVRKEMYTFDSGHDSLTLRPEMTASVARAFIQHGLSRIPGSERLYYIGPMFRRERPQKGRQRQFHQVGVEVLGIEDAYVDAETIEMVLALLRRLGIGGTTLLVNSVGCPACRPAYRERLHAWLAPVASRLCADCQRRVVENPQRVFDCKVEADRALLAGAPAALHHLCAACGAHWERFLEHIGALGIAHRIEPRLVRGLDYYVRTAFEIVAEEGLGSQNALMGGGRYDGLLKDLGGPDLAGFGWALGLERLLMLMGRLAEDEAAVTGAAPCDLFIAHIGEEAFRMAARCAAELRARGVSVRLDPRPAKLAAQMGKAAREHARFVLIVGGEEVQSGLLQLKEMATGLQERVPRDALDALAERIRHAH